VIQDRVVAQQDMDFGNPRFFEHQGTQMFLGMNASDASGDERADYQF
jgi:hypothetical protein